MRPPRWPMELVDGHPLAHELELFVPLVRAGIAFDLVTRKTPSAGVLPISVTQRSRFAGRIGADRSAAIFDNASIYLEFPITGSHTYPRTLAAGVVGMGAIATGKFLIRVSGSTSDETGLLIRTLTGPVLQVAESNATGTVAGASSSTLATDDTPRVVGVFASGSLRTSYEDLKAPTTNTGARTLVAPTRILIGTGWNGVSLTGYFSEAMEYAAVWKRALNAAEAREVNTHPWQIVRAYHRKIYSFSSGVQTRTVSGSGGIEFAGAAGVLRQAKQFGAGGLVFGGAAVAKAARAVTASGGLVFGGEAVQKRASVPPVSGGVIFGGAASVTTQSSGTSTRTVVGSGGIEFGGAAVVTRICDYVASGGLTFGGEAGLIRINDFVPSGGLVLGGAAAVLRRRIVGAAGGIEFGGAAVVSTREPTRTVVGSGGIEFGGAASVTTQGGTAVTNYTAGSLVAESGIMQSIYLADAVGVPVDAVFIQGIAHSSLGFRYVCPWPTIQTVGYKRGQAIRADGAQTVALSLTTEGVSSGFSLSSRGELLISLSAEDRFKDGVGIKSTGALPVSSGS